jgi:hypothetical protein
MNKVLPTPKTMKKKAQMEYVLSQYRLAHPNTDPAIEPHLVAPWAIKKGIIIPRVVTQEDVLRRDLSTHLKSEHVTDPQDRRVRKNHSIPVEVQTQDGVKRRSKWYSIFEAPAPHMHLSLALRRSMALSDCQQLELDLRSYNDNNIHSAVLPNLDYNFNLDIEEANLPTTYPAAPPEDADEC